jgi:hypothetical protein
MTSLVSSATAEESESPFSVDFNTYIASDYMFRGQNLYDGTSVQPSVGVNYDSDFGTLSALGWAHFSAEGDRQEEKFTEVDATLSYSYTFDPLTVSIGNSWYTYPRSKDEIDNTAEAFITLIFDDTEYSPFLLTPTVSVFHDYEEFDNQYYELGLSHTFEVGSDANPFVFTPFAAFGFASNAEKIYEDNGLVQITWGVSWEFESGDVSVVPNLSYTHKIDDNTVNEFWFGLSFGFSV